MPDSTDENPSITLSSLKPGDIIIMHEPDNEASSHHCFVYIGNKQGESVDVVHARDQSKVCKDTLSNILKNAINNNNQFYVFRHPREEIANKMAQSAEQWATQSVPFDNLRYWLKKVDHLTFTPEENAYFYLKLASRSTTSLVRHEEGDTNLIASAPSFL